MPQAETTISNIDDGHRVLLCWKSFSPMKTIDCANKNSLNWMRILRWIADRSPAPFLPFSLSFRISLFYQYSIVALMCVCVDVSLKLNVFSHCLIALPMLISQFNDGLFGVHCGKTTQRKTKFISGRRYSVERVSDRNQFSQTLRQTKCINNQNFAEIEFVEQAQ